MQFIRLNFWDCICLVKRLITENGATFKWPWQIEQIFAFITMTMFCTEIEPTINVSGSSYF